MSSISGDITNNHSFSTFSPVDPSCTSPNPSCTSPNPSCTSPNPSCTSPNPSCTSPNPSCTSPNPSCTSPNPSCTSPNPSCTSPNPSCTSPNPSCTSPNPSCTSPNPSCTSPNPSCTSPNPSFTSPNPSCTSPNPSALQNDNSPNDSSSISLLHKSLQYSELNYTLDTISSAETICRPTISTCEPFKLIDDSPFSKFSVDNLDSATDFNVHLNNRSVAYYGEFPYSYGNVQCTSQST